jgi:hypothetical protein
MCGVRTLASDFISTKDNADPTTSATTNATAVATSLCPFIRRATSSKTQPPSTTVNAQTAKLTITKNTGRTGRVASRSANATDSHPAPDLARRDAHKARRVSGAEQQGGVGRLGVRIKRGAARRIRPRASGRHIRRRATGVATRAADRNLIALARTGHLGGLFINTFERYSDRLGAGQLELRQRETGATRATRASCFRLLGSTSAGARDLLAQIRAQAHV